jgi:hypothetical protein
MSEQSHVFQMRLRPAFLKQIDELRRSQPDIPARAEAIRRLCGRALAEKGQSPTNVHREASK